MSAVLPKAGVRPPTLTRALLWLVPLCAAAAAVYCAVDQYAERGPLIAVRFPDAAGIRNGDTPVLHRGISIGKVVGVELSPDNGHTIVRIRLLRGRSEFADDGAAFWIVSPEVTEAGFGGLNTLFSGPYIDSRPGKGAPQSDFAGLKGPPREKGLRLTVLARRLKGLRPGAPVSYRGVPVGVVDDVRLSGNSGRVEIGLIVRYRYAALVRERSKFWTAGGFDFKGGLLSGVEVKLDSLRDLVSGEVAFATPERDMGPPVQEGARFTLEEEPRKEWLAWSPRLAITPAALGEEAMAERFPTGRDLMEAKLK